MVKNSASSKLRSISSDADYVKKIIHPLRKIMQLLDTHSRKLLKQHDLTVPQIICLYEVLDKDKLTIANLARNVHVTPSTLIGIVDRLEKKGLIKRVHSMVDRRQVFVTITAKGQDFVIRTPYLLHNRLHHALERLTAEKRDIIAGALTSVVRMLEEE